MQADVRAGKDQGVLRPMVSLQHAVSENVDLRKPAMSRRGQTYQFGRAGATGVSVAM